MEGRVQYSWSIKRTNLERATPWCGSSLLDLLESPGRCRRIPAAAVAMFVSELLFLLLGLSDVAAEFCKERGCGN